MNRLLVVVFAVLVLFFGWQQFSVLNSAYDSGRLFGNLDWRNHMSMWRDGAVAGGEGYPGWVYFFYPGLKFVFFHVFVVIPCLLWLVSRRVGVSVWLVVFLFVFFGLPLDFVDHGYLKQVLFTEFGLVLLWLRLCVGSWLVWFFGGLFGLLVNGWERFLGYFGLLFVQRFNVFGYYLSRGQLMGFWAVFVLPWVLWRGLRGGWLGVDLFWLGVLGLLLGFFETRVLLSLLVLFLPFVARALLPLVGVTERFIYKNTPKNKHKNNIKDGG